MKIEASFTLFLSPVRIRGGIAEMSEGKCEV